MNVLFEEDGAFKTGTIVADNDSSLQVDTASGKRIKLKAAHVLLRFAAPGAGELLAQAEAEGAGLETEFLWEVCGEAEFGFEELAAAYAGHKPTPVEATAVLLALHTAPIYFHRKGKGRFRKAPPEILQAALAGLEKKRQQALAIEHMADELKAGRLPPELPPLLAQLLYKPDRNRPETKALEAACGVTGESPERLLSRCGALADSHAFHLGRFLFEHFREGTNFPAYADAVDPTDLPHANVRAFSIDDAHTTEIDDAFSLQMQPDGGMRVGIHIAAPGLGFGPPHTGSDLGRIARDRLSTVYMPGRKITMLPEAVVESHTLAAGRTVPALSLYLDVASDLRVLGHETKIECVPVAANLRHHDIEPVFNAETLATGLGDFPYRDELKRLWEFATVLEGGRGQAATNQNRKDYNFVVDWAAQTEHGAGRVTIEERPRGSPLDTLVAELMIVANATWGALLRDAGIPGMYRAQTAGKARMTTVAAPHEGLGVDCYAWSTSPLRRFTDLANQWQLIAHLRGEKPPYPPKSADLMAALRDFELTYASYAEFQRGMERYWCLRWLRQEDAHVVLGHVLRESLVRLDDIPLVLRVPSLPDLPRGAHVQLSIEGIDLLEAELRPRYLELAPELASNSGSDTAFAGDEGEDLAE